MGWLADAIDDGRYAVRLLVKAPAFTIAAVTTLAIGIGANTAVFSVVDAVLVRPLSYPNADRLVFVFNRQIKAPESKLFETYRDFDAYARAVESFEDTAAVTWAIPPALWRGNNAIRGVLAIPVSASFFSTLGVSPMLGETFRPEDERSGCSVVLSHEFWQNELGARLDIVGKPLDLDRRACTVKGVMPAEFVFYPARAHLWTLLGPDFVPSRHDVALAIVARLKPDATVERARAEAAAIHASLHGNEPDQRELTPFVSPLQREFTWLASRTLRTTLIALTGAVATVLFVACLNVAILVLGRSTARARELAVRSAIGAGRLRLVRQLLTEGFVLTALGSVAGVLLAYAAIRYFHLVNPIELPPGADIALRQHAFVFTAVLSIVTTLTFGLVPAWRGSVVSPIAALKSARGSRRSATRLMRTLVMGQVALSVVLLGAAAVLIDSVVRMTSEPLGFEPRGLFTTGVVLPDERYPSADRLVQFTQSVIDRTSAIDGVTGIALSSDTTFGGAPNHEFETDDRAASPEQQASFISVSPEYFRVYQIAVPQGRAFADRDAAESEPVAIVNEAFARKYFAGGSVLGRRIRLVRGAGLYGPPTPARTEPWITVVGIARNVKGTSVYREMSWSEASPTVYRPLSQSPARALSLAFRTTAALGSIGERVQHNLTDIDREMPVSEIVPADRFIARQLTYPRFRSVLFGAFAMAALLLAAVGLHGILWQFVAERRHELAVRLALGSSPRQLAWMVTRYGGDPVVAGLAAGLLALAAAGRLLTRFVYGARTFDPAVIAIVILTMLLVTGLAVIIPARRATHADAAVALREE